MLERFSGYTYTTLMNEDPEFLRVLAVELRGTPRYTEGVSDPWQLSASS